MNHPNIIQLHEVFEDDLKYSLIMEHIDGVELGHDVGFDVDGTEVGTDVGISDG